MQQALNVQALSKVDVGAYTGIEIQEWSARIADVVMWLMDHQMNVRLSEVFGQYFVRLPLRKSEFLFALYERFTAPLLPVAKKAGESRRRA